MTATTLLWASLAATLAAGPATEAWKTTPLPGPIQVKANRQGLVQLNGIALYFAIYGTGEPVILLHGGGGNSDHWANQLSPLARKFQVVLVDSRGHGRSTRDRRPLSYALMASDVLALMDLLELTQAALVGWSDGAAVALELALKHPKRVSKLVAYGTHFNPMGAQRGGGAAFAAYFARCEQDYARLSRTPRDFQGLLRALRTMWQTEPNYSSEQLASLEAPTLIISGEHDEIVRPEHLKEVAGLIAGARLMFIPNSSHFAHFQEPEAFNQALLSFLASPSE